MRDSAEAHVFFSKLTTPPPSAGYVPEDDLSNRKFEPDLFRHDQIHRWSRLLCLNSQLPSSASLKTQELDCLSICPSLYRPKLFDACLLPPEYIDQSIITGLVLTRIHARRHRTET